MSRYTKQVLERIETDERVVAVWMVDGVRPEKAVSIGIAVRDEHYADFYAHRAAWLRDILPVAHVEDITHFPALLLALLHDGAIWTVELLPWASVPEHKPLQATILLDRSQHLAQRWLAVRHSSRVSFAELDRWSVQFWVHAWAALQSMTLSRSYAVYHAAQAYIALVHFVTTATRRLHDLLSWDESLNALNAIEPDANVHAWVRTMIDWFERKGREIAQSSGWKYPVTVERAILSATAPDEDE